MGEVVDCIVDDVAIIEEVPVPEGDEGEEGEDPPDPPTDSLLFPPLLLLPASPPVFFDEPLPFLQRYGS